MTEQEPTILQVLREQRAALLRGDVATLQQYASRWQSVEDTLADSIELLARDIAERQALGLDVSRNSLYRLDRYQRLLEQTRDTINGFAVGIEPDIRQQQTELWTQGQVDAIAQLEAITGASWSTLPVSAGNTFIGFAVDGSPLRSLLLQAWPDAADRMTNTLLQGIALGKNPRNVARLMQEDTQASLQRMLTVARTETLRAYRESSRDMYAKSGVVEQYRRLATRSVRTCFLCVALDRTLHPVTEPLPTHPNCRCTSVPVVSGYDVNLGMSSQEWFDKQDADTQRRMLGNGRYNLYKRGTPLTDFVDVYHDPQWGATLRAKPIAGL